MSINKINGVNMIKRLSELKMGEKAKIVEIKGNRSLKKRIMEKHILEKMGYRLHKKISTPLSKASEEAAKKLEPLTQDSSTLSKEKALLEGRILLLTEEVNLAESMHNLMNSKHYLALETLFREILGEYQTKCDAYARSKISLDEFNESKNLSGAILTLIGKMSDLANGSKKFREELDLACEQFDEM